MDIETNTILQCSPSTPRLAMPERVTARALFNHMEYSLCERSSANQSA